jgi:hypothetical protein
MIRLAKIRFRGLPIPAFFLTLFLPVAAFAGGGDENWGEMVWGSFAGVDIPALPAAGLAILTALLLGLSCWLLAARRRWAKHP